MTYNIRHCRGIDGKVDCSRIVDVISAAGADVICLQEVDRGLLRTGLCDQADYIADALEFHHVFHANFGLPFAGMGNAILSRHPIYSTWNKRMPFFGEPRGLLYAALEIESNSLNVLCTHFGLTIHQRMEQVQTVCQAVEELSGPTVFAGDLNCELKSDELQPISTGGHLQDCGPTDELSFTSDRPEVKIDFIWHTRDIRLLNSSAIDNLASDHRPVVARLEIH